MKACYWELASAGHAKQCKPQINELLSLQLADGGWSQTVPQLKSDAFATGQTLYALSLAGYADERPEIKRGIDFLVATQTPDGSWPMSSRSTPDGSPREFEKLLTPITCAASSWATLGLGESWLEKNNNNAEALFARRLCKPHGRAISKRKRSSPGRTRTYDLAVNSRSLYQLSYRGSGGFCPTNNSTAVALGNESTILASNRRLARPTSAREIGVVRADFFHRHAIAAFIVLDVVM